MNVILHPDKNFLDPRNPSSPFQYRMQMAIGCWEFIYKNSFKLYGWEKIISVRVNGKRYDGRSKQELFDQLINLFF